MNNSVVEKICFIISKEMGVPTHDLQGDARLMEDLGADSLDVTSVLAAIQDELGVRFDVENIEKIHTINQLAQHVEELLAQSVA